MYAKWNNPNNLASRVYYIPFSSIGFGINQPVLQECTGTTVLAPAVHVRYSVKLWTSSAGESFTFHHGPNQN